MAGDETHWINQLKEGDAASYDRIWEAFYPKLVKFAERRMGDMRRREFDEEDIALSAMKSMFRAVAAKKVPVLDGSDDLLKFLWTIAKRKISKQREFVCRIKRGGGKIRGDSIYGKASDEKLGSFDDIESDFIVYEESLEEMAEAYHDALENLLAKIDDPLARQIVFLQLEGCSKVEMAAKLGRALRTIERKYSMLKKKCVSLLKDPADSSG